MTALSEIAIAVADSIAAASLPSPVQVERQWLPIHDLSEMQQTVISVIPAGQAREIAGRSRLRRTFRIEIGVQRKLSTDEPAEIDDLVRLTDAIAAIFENGRLSALPEVIWAKTEHQPVVALDHLNELRQFTSLLTLTLTAWS
jgi:hypothetical protein